MTTLHVDFSCLIINITNMFHAFIALIFIGLVVVFGDSSSDFDLALLRAKETLNLIYQRYEFGDPVTDQFFFGILNLPSFSMLFGGSSVTAGHDNYFEQSYPLVFQRRVASVFEALAVELVVRNIAQGSNNCLPYNLCLNSMGGDDVDWIGWEQSYNCGRSYEAFELVARVAGFQQAVIFFSLSGGFGKDFNCNASTDDMPWISEEWSPDLFNADVNYIKQRKHNKSSNTTLGVTSSYLKETLNEWYKEANSVPRNTEALGSRYPGVAAHGFSIWAESHNKCRMSPTNTNTSVKFDRIPCNALDAMSPCADQPGGAHWRTSETNQYSVDEQWHVLKHHPSVGLHLLRGELLAYVYLHILIDAMETIQRDGKFHNNYGLIARYASELSRLQPQIPPTPVHCHQNCQTKPHCYTDFRPHYSAKTKLSDIQMGKIIKPETSLTDNIKVQYASTHRGPYTFFKPNATIKKITTQHDFSPSRIHQGKTPSGWYFIDPPQLRPLKYHYLDEKPYFMGHGAARIIAFEVNITSAQFMYVCRAKATSLTDAKLFLELDVPSNVFSGLARQQYEPPEFLTSYLNETVKELPKPMINRRQLRGKDSLTVPILQETDDHDENQHRNVIELVDGLEVGLASGCVSFSNVPIGRHVLLAATGIEGFSCTISHIITY